LVCADRARHGASGGACRAVITARAVGNVDELTVFREDHVGGVGWELSIELGLGEVARDAGDLDLHVDLGLREADEKQQQQGCRKVKDTHDVCRSADAGLKYTRARYVAGVVLYELKAPEACLEASVVEMWRVRVCV
jgi:hypothetical protein